MSDKELLVVNESNRQQLLDNFTSADGLKEVINLVKNEVDSFEHDLSTGVGRKRTASLSAKVSKVKTKLDGMGKDLVADWKAKAKVVDQSRREMREELDALRDEARRPLTEWEAEEESRKKREAEEAEAKALVLQIESEHEIGLLLNEKFDRERAEAKAEAERIAREEAERKERERVEHEAKLRREAAEKAEMEKAEAIERQKKAEEDARIAEEMRKRQAKLAERAAAEAEKLLVEREAKARIKAEEAAKQAAEDARLAEIKRQEEEQARIKREEEAREANRRHVGNIRRQAKEDLISAGLTEEDAKVAVLAISNKSIRNISIKY